MLAAPAAAQSTVLDRLPRACASDPVYVHPGTDALSRAEADRLRDAIDEAGAAPVFDRDPAESARGEAGSSTQVASSSAPARGRARASTQSSSGTSSARSATISRATRPPALATRAFRRTTRRGSPPSCTTSSSASATVRSGESGESEGGGGFPHLAAGQSAARSRRSFGFRGYRRRQRRERELAEVKAVAREDLVALADDVVGLDEQVEAHPDAKEAYLRAMEAYQRADDAFDRARSPGGPRARLRSARRLPLRDGDGESAHSPASAGAGAAAAVLLRPASRHVGPGRDLDLAVRRPDEGAGLRGRRPARQRRRGA